MSDIFLAYASKDRERVQPLIAALESTGWSVFWDRTIPAGLTWRQFISDELRDARCVVVVWSRASVKSEPVQEEADEGKAPAGAMLSFLRLTCAKRSAGQTPQWS